MDPIIFILVILAGVAHAVWNFFTKKTKADRVTMLWLGQLLVGTATLPITLYFSEFDELSLKCIPYVILTGVIHAFYLCLLGWSYTIGEVSTVYPISRGMGIVGTFIIASIFGIDQVSIIGMLGILSISIGIFCLGVKRGVNGNMVLLSAILVGITISMYSVIDKLGVQTVPAYLYCSIIFLSTAFFLSPLVFYKRKPHVESVLTNYKMHSFTIGLAMLSTYSLILYAFQNAQASYVVALREVSIIVASILGVVFMKEATSKLKILGIAFIMLGAITIKFA
jgi:uncharacterized membrane protein